MKFDVPKNLAMAPGIYAITNHVNGRRYIGSGKRLLSRYYTHLSALQHGKHRSHLLQADYKEFGTDSFSFSLLEQVVDPNCLVGIEQRYLDQYFDQQNNCYNASATATSSLHVRSRCTKVVQPFVDLEGELWRPVVGYPGYDVSNYGRVRSYRRPGRSGLDSTPRLRKITAAKKRGGYLTVMLRRNATNHLRYVHHLVLEAFKGPCPPGMQARHAKDPNVANNSVDNLEWGTAEENTADKIRHGTSQHGERNHQCKLSDADVETIRTSNLPGKELAIKFKVRDSQISRIKHGVRRGKAIH